MATELETKLNQILNEKITKIIPENIKKDVQIFNITGTYEGEINNQDINITQNGTYTADNNYTGLGEVTVNVQGGSGGVKKFATVEAMNNSTGNQEGDLAIVYSDGYIPITSSSLPLTTAVLPNTITTSITVNTTYNLWAGNGSGCNLEIDLTASSCRIFNQSNMRDYARYTSSDGKNYTFASGSKTITFSPTITAIYGGSSDYCLEFLKLGGKVFDGLFSYNGSSWSSADNGLSSVQADVVSGITFLGANGVQTGNLGDTINLV